MELELLGCLASTTETPRLAGNPAPEVMLTAIGEYSSAPVFSPIGNVKEPTPAKVLIS